MKMIENRSVLLHSRSSKKPEFLVSVPSSTPLRRKIDRTSHSGSELHI